MITLEWNYIATAMLRDDGFWYPGVKTLLNGNFSSWIEFDLPFESEVSAKREAAVLAKMEMGIARRVLKDELQMLSMTPNHNRYGNLW